MLPLRAGDVVFIPPGPDYPHQIINTSDAPLHYLSISTKESAGDLRIPGFRQVPGAGPALTSAQPFEVIDRRGPGLDYWDGEP